MRPAWEAGWGRVERLRSDGECLVFRALAEKGSGTVLVVALASDQPEPGTVERLKHEYALRHELDPAWAVRPRALADDHGRTALVLDDPGAELLSRLLGRPWETRAFLRVAIGVSEALGHVHARGLIHRDVKPDHVFVDPATGAAWFTGFGIASRLARERQVPELPETIAGTLAYMAPEQTGRMNRSVDARSDLYALGVTFYQMLTGELPFTASDPMELVHCHIARQPAPPAERAPSVPPAISAIAMKLLAKMAEDRYQTAAGVAADLRRCLEAHEAGGAIEVFPLGGHDVPDVLRIPEKLYGREAEVGALVTAFEGVVGRGAPELVLVSGYSGIGKSSVVHELHKVLARFSGLFASGKFDQYKRDIPYATLAQAFQSLVRQLLGRSASELALWREALLAALGSNGGLMVNLIPELAHIIGEQPPVPELPPQDALSRFMLVFRRLLGVFARPGRPLVIFLDDLQWLDGATLDLIEHLITHPEVQHLLLIGAYRSNEVGGSHPLTRRIAVLRHCRGRVAKIELSALTTDDVAQLISDALHRDLAAVQPLARLVHLKTGGNPFFTIQFLTVLAEDGLLAFDHESGTWRWDLARIRAKGYTQNVADLMGAKLQRMPRATRFALGRLACLGNAARTETLTLVHGGPEDKIHADLWEAVRAGIVFRMDRTYAFHHDRVHEAAYALIPEGDRAAAHLEIGRVLSSRTDAEQLKEAIFDIVNHLNRGVALITTREERSRVAELNLKAGRRAKLSTAYASALAYFATGTALMREEAWQSDYALLFALNLQQAECEYLTGDTATAEQRLERLAQRAANLVDAAAVACLRVELYTALDHAQRAIEIALEFLDRAGMPCRAHPSDDEVAHEVASIRRRLGGRSVDQLIDLPPIADPVASALLDVLAVAHAPANFTAANLLAWIIARMVNLSIEHGNGDASPLGYVYLGMILGFRFGDSRAAFQFGQLGVDLVERAGHSRYKSHVYLNFGNAINPWTRHVRSSLKLLHTALDAAMDAGQLTFAAYSYTQLITAQLAAGEPLNRVQQFAEEAAAFVRRTGFGTGVDLILGHLGLIRALVGATPGLSSFQHEQFDETRFEQHLASDPARAMAACWYWTRKLQAHFLAGDGISAVSAASKAKDLLWTSPGFLLVADYHFYAALTLASCDHRDAGVSQLQKSALLEDHRRQLDVWAAACPENFRDRQRLVAAELARLEGRDLEAERLFEEAIQSARENGFVQNEAIANELAARFYAARGFETIAQAYLRNARYGYLRWGAEGKVRQLDQFHPQLRAEPAPPVHTATTAAPTEGLDLASVVKMSQAVSGEIVLERLIDKLMSIVLEHAGAQRGLLILPYGEAQRIQAEAAVGEEKVELGMRDAAVTPADMPESILRYVIRTHESVLLDDASQANPYSSDPYIARGRSRSILCLPLLKQASLIGVLYLENPLAARVFTPARIAVLNLLASQAAISLENARLYAEVQKENAERRQSEEALRRSEERYALAVQAAGDGHTEWIVATDELYASPRLIEMLGLPPDTRFAGRADFLARFNFHPEDRERALRTLDEYYAGDSTRLDYEVRILRGDETRWLHITVLCSRDATGAVQRSNSAITDITERKLAEEALRQSEERFALAVAGANEGIFDWDLRSDRVYVSHRAQELFGLPASELWRQRREWREILNFHPEDARLQHDSIKALIAGERPTYDVEFRIILADGSHRWFRQRGIALRDATGRAYRMVGSIGDITDRKRAQEELTRLERRLRQAQRLEAMGTLASGIAHDFNNILGAVLGFGERALRAAPSDSSLAGYLDRIISAGERGRALVDRILAFSSSSAGERLPVHVEKVVAEGLDLLAGRLPSGVRVAAELRAGRAAILGDPTQVHRVLMNLATNAIQAMPSGGVLRVALDVLRVAEARLAAVGGLEPGEYVVLTVADEGTGMPAEVLERIFDPFFTTKETGSGTGLGLSLVHGIVANMEGAIDVTTRQEEGSVFMVYLPRSGAAEVDAGDDAPTLPRGARQRVLLVDDEEALVVLGAETLEEIGYQPLGFTSSSAALQAFRADPNGFDAVITDERMPGMTGSALIKALRAIRRDLPILLMSGFVGGGVASRAREAGADEVLKKPLSERDLATSLARVLRS